MRTIGFCFVSAKLRSVLESVSAEIEYLPVDFFYHSKGTDGEYFLANPLRRIKGVDLQNSKVQLDEAGLALEVELLVLSESHFTGIAVAVLHETLHLVVQPGVAAAIRNANCTGCAFLPASSVRI